MKKNGQFLMSHWHFEVSVHYLLNQWMDLHQTCLVTLLGVEEELNRFTDFELIFKVTLAI